MTGSLSVSPLAFVALALVFGLAAFWARRSAADLDAKTLRKRGGTMLGLGAASGLGIAALALMLNPTPDPTLSGLVGTALRALMLGTLMVALAIPAAALLAIGLVWMSIARDKSEPSV